MASVFLPLFLSSVFCFTLTTWMVDYSTQRTAISFGETHFRCVHAFTNIEKTSFFHKNCLRLEIFSHIEKSRDESLHPWTTNTKSGCLCFIRISKFKKQNRQLLWKMRRACIGHIWCYKNRAQAEHAWCHKDEIISGTYTGKRQNGVRGFSLCLWQWVLMHVDQNESNYFLFSILIATYLL